MSPEVVIKPEIDKGVVAYTAHREPMTNEVDGTVVDEHITVRVQVCQQVVQIERSPANTENYNNRYEHLDCFLLHFTLRHVRDVRLSNHGAYP